MKYARVKQWSELRSQGQRIEDFSRDKTGNVWLEEAQARFIDAIKLRTNTFGTRTILAPADKKVYVTCRRCSAQPETHSDTF